MATFGTFVNNVSLKASELNTFFARTAFTPVFRQSATITTSTSTRPSNYFIVNKLVFCSVRASATTSGTSNNRIEFDLPVAAASNAERVIGSGFIEDNSANDIIRVIAVRVSTTRVAFLTNASTSLSTYLGQTGGPTLTIANLDIFSLFLTYEAA
jgi:hypothetical protein